MKGPTTKALQAARKVAAEHARMVWVPASAGPSKLEVMALALDAFAAQPIVLTDDEALRVGQRIFEKITATVRTDNPAAWASITFAVPDVGHAAARAISAALSSRTERTPK